MKNIIGAVFAALGLFSSSLVFSSTLDFSRNYRSIDLVAPNNVGARIGIPAAITRIDNERLAVASYLSIWIFNERTGETHELVKPSEVGAWYPTGLSYDRRKKELFVANYLGKDILVLKNNSGRFKLKKRIQDVDLVGPENIDLSRDGKYFAVADFDNNGILLFERSAYKKLWYKPFGRAHGVSFNQSGDAVVAAGLNPPQVISFDIKGEQIAKKGNEGWERNGYLWPTGVALDPVSGQVWVSDAHLGKIRALNSALDEGVSFGMNGLGGGMFNMPYGIFYDADGKLWITDTFKSRVVLLDREKRVLKSFNSAPETTPNLLSCQGGGCVKKLDAYGQSALKPVGPGYKQRINQVDSVLYDFGVYGKREWNPGFNHGAFNSPNKGQFSLAATSPIFSSSIYYWVQAQISGGHLVYGSPQVREWIVDFSGLACPVPLGLNYWLDNGKLKSDQHVDYSLDELVSFCAGKVSEFNQRVSKGVEPFSAYSESVLGKDSKQTLPQLVNIFMSDRGRQLYKALCSASNGQQRRQASLKFIKEAQVDPVTYLAELWTAKIFASLEDGKSQSGHIECAKEPK